MKRYLLLPALLAMFRLQAQQIEEYRYWINDDPAGVTVAGIGPNVQVNLASNLVLPALTKDYNTITIQFKDTNDVYSVPVSKIFTRNTGAVTGYEYWIDDAIANRVTGTTTAGNTVTLTSNIPLCLTVGTHLFTIRFSSNSGTWSVPITRQFTSSTSPDSDLDGTCNALDGCPNDPNKIAPGACGCDVADVDTDGDGLLDCTDPCPLLANLQPGDGCDDGNASTMDDVITANCICAGILVGNDCEGVPGGPAQPGTACNDNDDCTVNDVYDAGCNCAGTLLDTDDDGTCDAEDACLSDPLKTVPGNCGCGNPEPGTLCNDNNVNTTNDVIGSNCTCAGTPTGCTTDLELVLQTDGTSTIVWELREQGTNALMQSGGGQYPASPNYALSTCLPNGDYYLVVGDDDCDGITNGGYFLRTVGGTMLIDNRSNFLSGCTSQISAGEGFTLPVGTDRLLSTSCDKLDWRSNEYIVATDNASVTAVWNNFPAGSTERATTGYEMWWFNPNGGYTFRRFQSHATANGMTANAVRACHFKINSWSSNQLQNGVLYNVKVRSRVIGANAAWGAACRFVLDPVRAECPLTHLLDVPGNQYLSCGATRAIGSGAANLVHAKVATRMVNNVSSNANKYQFRFITDSGGSTVIKTSTTGQYWVNTSGLAPCKTYEVEVRASFDNGTSYCDTYAASNPYAPKWGRVCLLSTSGCPSGNGGNQNMAGDVDSSTGSPRQLVLYPNPNQGDQLFLRIDQVKEGLGTVSVDILDTFGKRVGSSTVATSEGVVNTVIDLRGELAAGMYLVNITAGNDTFTERLVIQP